MALVLLHLILLVKLFMLSCGEFQRFDEKIKSDGSLSILVVGDWGRNGNYNQSQVATQMGKIGEELDINFVISTGDNFYEDGLQGVYDNQFQQSFTDIYTANSLQKQWYSVLGNHDYQGDVLAQLSPILQKFDNRWFCMRSFIVNTENVDLFFVDTTPFVKKYWTHPKDHHYDWRHVEPRDLYIENLLKELDLALKESRAPWKFVVGHHTMRSVSQHGDTIELLQELLPILKANNVDLYINGHDHCLEHISSLDSPIQFFTSGGGSKAWRGSFTPNADKLRFFYDGQGFMSMKITSTTVDLVFYDIFGTNLYQWSMNKQLLSHVDTTYI
ncbi:putative Acid phosphatase, Peroxidase [Dioscorea sansibarensis]